MAREEEFLAAIEAAPDDLVLRNVFADWLDENGRDGGPFLRAECRLVGLPLGTPGWHEAFRRYRGAGESVPGGWRMGVERHDEAHWLRMATRSAWVRLDRWLVDGDWGTATSSGASTKEIDAIERAIGQELPPDVRESFSIHDGGSEVVFGFDLLSAKQSVSEWRSWRGCEDHNEEFRWEMTSFPENAIALDYANPGWIPLTRTAGADHIGVDLSPGPEGRSGQVINFGRDERKKGVLARCWADFLADLATFLERQPAPNQDEADWVGLDEWYAIPFEGMHPHDRLGEWLRDGSWPPSPHNS